MLKREPLEGGVLLARSLQTMPQGDCRKRNGIGSTIAGSSPLSLLPDGQQRAERAGLEFFGKKEEII